MNDNGFILLPNTSFSGRAELLLPTLSSSRHGCAGQGLPMLGAQAGKEARGTAQHLHQPWQPVRCCVFHVHTESCSAHCPLERLSCFLGLAISRGQLAYLFFHIFSRSTVFILLENIRENTTPVMLSARWLSHHLDEDVALLSVMWFKTLLAAYSCAVSLDSCVVMLYRATAELCARCGSLRPGPTNLMLSGVLSAFKSGLGSSISNTIILTSGLHPCQPGQGCQLPCHLVMLWPFMSVSRRQLKMGVAAGRRSWCCKSIKLLFCQGHRRKALAKGYKSNGPNCHFSVHLSWGSC